MSTSPYSRKGGFIEGVTTEDLGGDNCCGGSAGSAGGCCGEPTPGSSDRSSGTSCCGEPVANSVGSRLQSRCCG